MTSRTRPVIAIVGRPNVGKSTLFNRIVGERKAVVHDLPGMTRDRHYADCDYQMRPITLIDTGGYEDHTESTLLNQMRTQVLIAIEEADKVIFVADVHEPNDPIDEEILNRLRSSGKSFYLVVNKCESKIAPAQAYADFSRFGLDEIYPISGLHGDGVYDLLDDVTQDFERWDPDEDEDDMSTIRVAIVGRQNVGKSTLLNKLFGQDRVIANSLAGTTRDAIDAPIEVHGKPYLLIDTAGIRRRGRIEVGPEKLSVHSSFRAIDRAHVCLLVIDINEGITSQDNHIAGYILERKKACILVLNKWDLVEDRERRFGDIIQHVRREFNFMPWAPILTVSAITGQRTNKVWDLVDRCAENFQSKFRTAVLNVILKKAKTYLSPPARSGRTLTMKYVTQTRSQPPTLSIFVNDPDLLHFSYRRYLTNQFYKQLELEGTPLILRFRRKAPPRGWEKDGDPTNKDLAILSKKRFFGNVYDDEGEEYAREVDLENVADLEESEHSKYYDGGDGDDDGDDVEVIYTREDN